MLKLLDSWDKYDKKKLQEYAKNKFNYEIVGEQFYEIYKMAGRLWW